MPHRSLGLALVLAAALVAAPAEAKRLLRDDFDGSSLDTTKWFVPTGPGSFFGRTQIRPPSEALTVTGGVIRLQLDTFNPTAQVPGDSFWGSEIDSLETWQRGKGLAFAARSRLVCPLAGGLVGSVFSFVFLPAIPGHDEIDFELLSNDVVASEERVLTNVFDDDDFSQPGDKAFADVTGLDLCDFHTWEARWLPDRVEWWVDGALVRSETDTVPDDAQNVRLNSWAPDQFFSEAYDASLVPAAAAEDNEIYYYEVDWAEVRRLGSPLSSASPPARLALAAGLATLGAAAALRLRQPAPRRSPASPRSPGTTPT